ncbi:MAG TPA: SCO family protein [Anaeromyxobacteraceae bacterium]|nr:SCO family protein [Anaeromyxobacteraceae bacterium]
MAGARATLILAGLALWLPARAAGNAGQAAEPDPEARARAYFTDTPLLTQDGKEVRFYSDVLKDRVVVMDFIFTNCAMACPMLTEKLNQVRRELGHLYGREVTFVSLSVDPERDTPQALRRFAEKHRASDAGWTWLTGKKQDVEHVLKKLGQWTEEIESHSTIYIAGNARTRRWTKITPDVPTAAFAERVRALIEHPPRPTAQAAPTAAR